MAYLNESQYLILIPILPSVQEPPSLSKKFASP